MRRLVVVLAFIAFASLGLPDTVLGVAWPSIRATFGRPLGQLGVLLAAGSGAYLVSSFFGGQIVRLLGVGRLLVGSSVLVTVALMGDALAPAWGWMIVCAAIGGLGAGAIDAGINAFAASHFSARVVNWLHAFWGVGATAGPLLMTAVLANQLGWRVGYGVLAAALGALTVFFLLTVRLWQMEETGAAGVPERGAGAMESIRRPAVVMQVALFFLYGGTESTAGSLLYSLFTEGRGMGVTAAGVTVGAYWGALTAGRIAFGQLAAHVSRRAVLRIGLGLAPAAAGMIWWAPAEWVGVIGAVLLGFGLAPVYPTLISVTPEHVGKRHAAQSVGFQVSAATAGIMAVPGVVGAVARDWGLEVVGVYLAGATAGLVVLHEVSMRLGEGRTAGGRKTAGDRAVQDG